MQEGYGFITFATMTDAQRVVANFANYTIEGVTLFCALTHQHNPTSKKGRKPRGGAGARPQQMQAMMFAHSNGFPQTSGGFMSGPQSNNFSPGGGMGGMGGGMNGGMGGGMNNMGGMNGMNNAGGMGGMNNMGGMGGMNHMGGMAGGMGGMAGGMGGGMSGGMGGGMGGPSRGSMSYYNTSNNDFSNMSMGGSSPQQQFGSNDRFMGGRGGATGYMGSNGPAIGGGGSLNMTTANVVPPPPANSMNWTGSNNSASGNRNPNSSFPQGPANGFPYY